MERFEFKYGRTKLHADIEEKYIIDTLIPDAAVPIADIEKEVIRVMENPTGTLPLKDIISKG